MVGGGMVNLVLEAPLFAAPGFLVNPPLPIIRETAGLGRLV
jgi:hypothetical protein